MAFPFPGRFHKNITSAVFLTPTFVKMPLFLAWNIWREKANIGDLIRCFKTPKLCYEIGSAGVEIENAGVWHENASV